MSVRFRRVTALLTLLGALLAGPAALAQQQDYSALRPSAPLPRHPLVARSTRADRNTYLILVDKSTEVMSVLRMGDDKQYSVLVRQMRCSTGSTPNRTPEGSFRIYAKNRWIRAVKGQYVQYSCRFNNHILIHSLTYSKADPKALVPQSYQDLGKPVSAGCVRLLARDSKWIFDNCPTGTQVKVVASGGPAVTALEPMPELPAGQTWDPTDVTVTAPAPMIPLPK